MRAHVRRVVMAMGIAVAAALCGCGGGQQTEAAPAAEPKGPSGPEAAASGMSDPDALVKLELDLPKAQLAGTPKPIALPHLDRTPAEAKPPLMVPRGLSNLAKGKPVTGSDAFPMVGDLAMVTDGDKAGQDGSYVELGPGKQWAQVDLGTRADIFAVVLWLYHGEQRAFHDVVVRVSDDPEFREKGAVFFNNDHDNSSGFGFGKDLAYIESHRGNAIDAKGVRGRYLRINTNGNTTDEMNRFTEVEVYGRPVK